MASNPTPEDDNVLLALADDMADGCHQHEVALGIKQNIESVMRAAMAAVVTARANLAAAKGAVTQKTADHLTIDTAAKGLLSNCRLRFVNLFGNGYNASWEEAGFPDGTTAVPDTMDRRFALLTGIKNYLTVHPAAESADLGVTLAAVTAQHTALSDARQALNNAKTARTTAIDAETAAWRTLRKRVRGLIDELGTVIADDDARYLDFGLNIPATPVAPGPIATLTAAPLGDGKVLCEWTYAIRGESFRILMKRQGIDTEFLTQGNVPGLEKKLAGLTVGQTIELQVIPHNEAGDGPGSPIVTVTVT